MKINENVIASTQDWLKGAEGMIISAYNPPFTTNVESQVVEPDKAVNLPAADRARMNRAKPGVRTRPEPL